MLCLVLPLHRAENLSKLIECPGVVRLHPESLLKIGDSCLAAAILRRSLLIYGAGGIIAPFAGIKLINLALQALQIV